MLLFCFTLVVFSVYVREIDSEATVVDIVPRQGSVNGATRITLYGSGFAESQFSLGSDPDIGNRVDLVSSTRVMPCDIHTDGCTKIQVTCNTRRMPADNYYIKLFIDGVLVPTDTLCGGENSYRCRFQANIQSTPTVRMLSPAAGLPGDLLTIDGKLFTDIYETNKVESSNGLDARILRVYLGGQTCELRIPGTDNYYGLGLYKSEDSDTYRPYGALSCKPQGSYVGNQNFTYIVDRSYGRSMAELQVLRISAQDQIMMYQTYAEVTQVFPSVGSVVGGTILTISGHYFDESDAPVQVTISGVRCIIQSLTSNQILCEIGPKPNYDNYTYPGNRGMMMKTWNSTADVPGDLPAVVASLGVSQSVDGHLDGLSRTWDQVSSDIHTGIIQGYFVPPSDNLYKFYIKSEDDSELWFVRNGEDSIKTLIAQNPSPNDYYSTSQQSSEILNLQKNQPYYMEVYHRDSSGRGHVQVAVHMYKTQYTGEQAGDVRNEVQHLSISSNIVRETQRLTLSGWTGQAGVDEVQEVEITSISLTDAIFRVGLYDVYTGPLNGLVRASDLAKEINKLPVFPAVEVIVDETNSGRTFTITFKADRGDWPDMTVLQDPQSPLLITATVRQLTRGVSSMTYLVLGFDGIPSTPIDVSTLSARNIKESLDTVFTVRCPDAMLNPMAGSYHQTYEIITTYPESGVRVGDQEPFCGSYSSLNPAYLYLLGIDEKEIDIFRNPLLCFAFKGSLESTLRINFNDSTDVWIAFEVIYPISDSWNHHCVDLARQVTEVRPGVTSAILKGAYITRNGSADILVDNVYIGTVEPTQDPDFGIYRRLKPTQWRALDVTVSDVITDTYDVIVNTYNCSYDLPLISLENTGISASGGANLVTYSGDTWPSGVELQVSRVVSASPPVMGVYSLTYEGHTLPGITSDVSPEGLQDLLESLPDMGKLAITRTGSCSGYQWRIEWKTAPGDHPLLQLDISGLTGTGVIMSVTQGQDGGVFFDPIPGDMLRTVHTEPQVIVVINNIPSICSRDCGYNWNISATPVLSAVSPLYGSVASGTELTVTGSGLDTSNLTNNVITIGGTVCLVTAASGDDILCTVGPGSAGTHDVILHVLGLGAAQYSNNVVQFTYNFSLYDVSPLTGGLGGGLSLTLTGAGFGPEVSVTVGGNNCHVTQYGYLNITCTLPSSIASGAVDIAITEGVTTITSPMMFVYDSSLTPIVTWMIDTPALVSGGTVIELSGYNFTSSYQSITVDGSTVNVTWYNDTSVALVLYSHDVGTYSLLVLIDGCGYAVFSDNTLPQVSYELLVTSVSPRFGSLYGSTLLTISGTGFSTDPDDVEVMIGGSPCTVTSLDAAEIQCETPTSAKTRVITNQGVHPVFGSGYAWYPQFIEIQVGDTVQWRWTTSDLLSGIGYRVEGVASPSDTEYSGSGLRSGIQKIPNGVYEYEFGVSGEYYYWSGGAVDDVGVIVMRGVVKVNPRSSTSQLLTVKVSGYQSGYVDGSTRRRKKRGAVCPDVTTSCSGSVPDTGEGPNFGFWSCATPTVTSIEPTRGPATDVITIHGTGFGSDPCQNQVMIGDYACALASTTTTQITCMLDTRNEMFVGTARDISIFVLNVGAAILTMSDPEDHVFLLLPHVATVLPASGSTAGGAAITISGGGFFDQLTSVMIEGVVCQVTALTYTEIVCTTGSAWATSADVQVSVMVYNQWLPTECTGNCTYEYSAADTAHVTAVTPTVITSANETVTLTGSGFPTIPADVIVSIGETLCDVISSSESEVTCNAGNPVIGAQSVSLLVKSLGYANVETGSITVTPEAPTIYPTSGSAAGGTNITISGFGFSDDAAVTIGNVVCAIQQLSAVSILCETAGGAVGTAELLVTSNGVVFPATQFNYDVMVQVTGLSVTTASPGDTLTITAVDMATDYDAVTVLVGGVACTLDSLSSTSITCTLGEHAAGDVTVLVHVLGIGYASGQLDFTYRLGIADIVPDSGSYAGGQPVVISGYGFSDNLTVTICGAACHLSGVNASQIATCLTPSNTGTGDTSCDVVVSSNQLTDTLTASYRYLDSLTPLLTSVTPSRGGTGGGTSITITGSKFGSTMSDVIVTIATTVCLIQSLTDTEIICITQQHKPSVITDVVVEIATDGIAKQASPGAAYFQYVDVWSSRFTWGGLEPPGEGDLVVIPSDMTVLLDMNTPVLKLLLIQGGQVIFDEVDVELQAEIILITGGGLLQVGTENDPFQHRAIITLHGHVKSKELPIYGTKCIAVREGRLELHGIPIDTTWTHLSATANAGDTTITLLTAVQWQAGNEIIIASTGLRHSQGENEKRTILSVSADGLTLTLDSALDYRHLGEEIPITGSRSLQARAEVGLLSHNVLIRGSDNPQWHDKIEACEAGFNTGEFATQTCFQGRFGEEIGSDQFGAHIIMHASRSDGELVMGRIENVELNYVGQAFRLGRYPIHFHLNGAMPSSYVRRCAIHRTFNRAVNIHGTREVRVQHNVVYNVMGGAFFLEDGVETGNILEYNLAIFVISSTSLQNDDITPAAFWITNPNNTVRHNAVAGGTHFGFWYRMHEHPDGPSFAADICPRRVPLGEFDDNTVHSQGWFGIWIFQHYYPSEGGSCDWAATPVPAKFYRLTAWNNEKGAEWVGAGALQFIDFLIVHNQLTGLEMKLLGNIDGFEYTADGPMIQDSVIVAGAGVLSDEPTQYGLVLPYARGMSIRGVTFVGFSDYDDQKNRACLAVTTVAGQTEDYNGGFTYQTSGLSFVQSADNKIYWRWPHEAVYHDQDGSLCGTADCKVVADQPALPPQCSRAPGSFWAGDSVPASVCDDSVKFRRFSFNNAVPSSLLFKNVTFAGIHGTTYSPFTNKRVTHAKGWMVLLVNHDTYTMSWLNAEQITNVSYSGTFYDFVDDDYVIMRHNFTQSPDVVHILEGDTRNETTAVTPESYNGDWRIDDTQLSYIISSKTVDNPSGSSSFTDSVVQLEILRCFYEDCSPPPDPSTLPPFNKRPDHATFWHDPESWNGTEQGWGGYYGNDTYGPPLDGDDVKISSDKWIVVRGPTAILGKIWIFGGLEFEFAPDPNGGYYEFTFRATHIVITGGRLVVGWEDEPFLGLMNIVLKGNHLTPDLPLSGGLNLGAKAIGVFGGLDLHGRARAVSWTHLIQTAEAGATSLVVQDQVDWQPGDEIVIAPTGLDLEETEIRQLTSVSADNVTLTWAADQPLAYRHYVTEVDLDGSRTYTMAAEVGLLTRNIKIIGEDYSQLAEQAFGARVLVGMFSSGDNIYSGYARLSDVEFYHTGQDGWTDWYDPRYSLAFLNIGDVTRVKPSYVTSCSFHHGFSPAIGVYGTNNLELYNNVIHHTVGSAVIVQGVQNTIRRNLIVQVIHPGVFNGREETRDEWDAGIEVVGATDALIQMNSVAGSHRALYRVDGEPCSKLGQPEESRWHGNVGHSSLSGVIILPKDGILPCSLLANFVIYRTYDFGMYVQTAANVKVVNYLSIDNQIGLFPMILEPASVAHQYADKWFEVDQSTFVGRSPNYGCSQTLSGPNIRVSVQGRSWESPGGGMVGLSWPTFSSGSNQAPQKPFKNIMSYQAIWGILRLTNITFSAFKFGCGATESDVIITTNPANDDVQHPVLMEDITLYDVITDNLAFIHRSTLSRVNPADCVDMECDAMKKALITDVDGSFLGTPGTLFSQSEWAWDGEPARGLGDYRIPTSFLTDSQGNRIDLNNILQGRGIIRDNTCQYHAAYQAYICHGLNYKMLHLESMDEDTESRRVSPVSVYSEGYIDLVNGPQDHGWCMGYTCQKRLSTFPFILAAGKTFEIYFTGTTPQDTRYHWLNTDESEAVVLATWYAQSYRLNVYVDGVYVMAKNGYYTPENQLAMRAPTTEGEYLPLTSTDPTGTNYFDRATQMLYVLLRGPTPVEVVTDHTIFVAFSLPFMSVDEFFGEKIVSNLAAFFDISPDKIRYAEAVAESRRRRRQAVFRFIIEVANLPHSMNQTDPGDLTAEQMAAAASQLINSFQLGQLGDVLNITILTMAVIEPPPQPGTAEWLQYTQLGLVGTVSLVVPEQLVLVVNPDAGTEGNVFNIQPNLQMTDILNNPVTQLGSFLNPWSVTVTMEMTSSSDNRALLDGMVEVSFSGSWANFTNLTVSHSGTYRLHFNVSSPADAVSFTGVTFDITVPQRRLSGQFASQPSSVFAGDNFNVSVELLDADTNTVLDIRWKDYNWTCEPFLYKPSIYPGELTGVTSQSLDIGTGLGQFYNLLLTSESQYVISIRCLSDPDTYNITFPSEAITAYSQSRQIDQQQQVTNTVQLRFYGDFATVAAGEEPYIAAAVNNHLWQRYDKVLFSGLNISAGSILATFYMSGSSADVTLTLSEIWTYLKQPMVIFYGDVTLTAMLILQIDGVNYVVDEAVEAATAASGLGAGAVAGIVLAVLAVVAVIISVLVWHFVSKKQIRTSPCHTLPCRMKTSTRRRRQRPFAVKDKQAFLGDSVTGSSTSVSTTSSGSLPGVDTSLRQQRTQAQSQAPRRIRYPSQHPGHRHPSLQSGGSSHLSSLDEPRASFLDPLDTVLYPPTDGKPMLTTIPVQPVLPPAGQDIFSKQPLPDLDAEKGKSPRFKLPPI